MLIHVQFPIVDLRALVGDDDSRLPVPSWPSPLVNEEFMRSAGVIRRRHRGGLQGWVAEENYCDARQAIKLHPTSIRDAGLSPLKFKIAFRRLHFDGTAVAKYEIGLATDKMIVPTDSGGFDTLLPRLANLHVLIRRPGGQMHSCRLFEAGRPLAALYASATSKHQWKGPQIWIRWRGRNTKRLVNAGTPALFIEASLHQIQRTSLPIFAREIYMKNGELALFHWWATLSGSAFPVWTALQRSNVQPQDVRKLRIYLLRLNAENQAFVRVLKAIKVDLVRRHIRLAIPTNRWV